MQRFAANALPLNVQQFSRFRSKADIWPDFMSTRPSCSASQTLDVVIPGPRALGSALRAVRVTRFMQESIS